MKNDIYHTKNLKVMKPSNEELPFDSFDYIFELALHGTKVLIYTEPNKITIKNQHGFILNKFFPELLTIKKIVKEKCIFAGEIILLLDGNPSNKHLQKRLTLKDQKKINYYQKHYPVIFLCHDILYEEKDLTNTPLIKRKNILKKYPDTPYFIKAPYVDSEGVALYHIVKKHNLAGIIAKNKNSRYLINKCSNHWIEIRNA